MAIINVAPYAGNLEKKQHMASVGRFGIKLPGNRTLTATDEFVITGIPTKSLVTKVSLVVEEAFGAGVTVNIGDGTTATKFGSALSLAALGEVAGVGTGYFLNGSDVVVKIAAGTLTTIGKAYVVVDYIELTAGTSNFVG